jgi:hypothetical protein
MSPSSRRLTWRQWLVCWICGCFFLLLLNMGDRWFIVASGNDRILDYGEYPARCIEASPQSVAFWLSAARDHGDTSYAERSACLPGQSCPARAWPVDGSEWLDLGLRGLLVGFVLAFTYFLGQRKGEDDDGQ